MTVANDTGPRRGSLRVFVSYSSQDVEAARQLRALLARNAATAWMAPDDIDGSNTWVDQILVAAKSCEVMVVLLSRHAVQSPHVAREVALAQEHGRAVIPVRLEPVELAGPLEYLLHLVQWVDAFPGPLARHEQAIVARLSSAAGRPLPAADGPAATPSSSRARPSRRSLVIGAAALAAVVAAAAVLLVRQRGHDTTVAGSSTGRPSHASGAPSGDALAHVPARVSGFAALAPYLARIGEQSHLPARPALALRTLTNSTTSVSFRTPTTWTQVDGANPYITGSPGRRIGELLISSVDQSRFYQLKAAGLFVGLAVPALRIKRTPDEMSPPQQYYDLGCINSRVIEIASPAPGQVEIWGACDSPEVIVLASLRTAAASVHIFGIVTDSAELDQLATVLASIRVDPAKVTVHG